MGRKERKDGLLSEAGEAGPREVAVSVSRQASLGDLLPLEGGGCPRAPVSSHAGGHWTLEATTAAGAQGKAPKKVIAQKVSGSVKWYNVKCGYGFIKRHDTQEEVFVHHSAIARSGPRRHRRGLGTREAVEFDVLQGERGTEAANVTRPAGAPSKSCCFCIHLGAPQLPCGTGGAKDDVVDGEDSRDVEDVATAKGQRYCLTSSPHTQRQRRFPPFREAQGATCSPATFAPADGQWAVHLPARAPAAGPEGAPSRRGRGLSYRLSRPRGRGTAADPKPSPDLAQEPEADKTGSRSDADSLQQGSPPRCGCHCPNNPCDCCGPRQLPDEQGQTPEGGEGEIGKVPDGKPACVPQKTIISERAAAVAKASSAAQAQ